MKAGLIVVALIALIALGVGGWVVGGYNRLVAGKADVDNAYHEVDNQLLRRNDLIPNLVEAVKGIAAQEQAVIGEITTARAAMQGAHTPEQKFAAGNQMDGALGRLLVVVENYPQIKSQENFLHLQDELAGTENRLAVARKRYNDVVRDFNVMVRSFPTNIFAGMFNFQAQPFYEVAPEARQVPKVSFPAAPNAQPAPSGGTAQPAPAGGH
jgi:LemA protein